HNIHFHPIQMAWGYFPEVPATMERKSFEGPIMTTMCPVPEPSGYGTIIQTPSLHPGLFSVVMPWISTLDMKKRMSRFSRRAHILSLARDKGSSAMRSRGHKIYPKSPRLKESPQGYRKYSEDSYRCRGRRDRVASL
ncbi:hypothetical protein KI387_023369, partial [Taxus chinensis]